MVYSSIQPISGATTPGQSGPGNDGKKGVLRIPQSSSCRLFSVISRTLVGGVLPLCRGAVSVFYSLSWLGNANMMRTQMVVQPKCIAQGRIPTIGINLVRKIRHLLRPINIIPSTVWANGDRSSTELANSCLPYNNIFLIDHIYQPLRMTSSNIHSAAMWGYGM